jgi:nucleotide-binding universal stress UspA family protein
MEVCIDGPDAAVGLAPLVVDWARRLHLWPRLVSVWAPGALHRLPDPEMARRQLSATAEDLGGQLTLDVDWEVLHAPSAPAAIVADAEQYLASLIVLAVRPHRRLQRLLGSVAMAVAHGASAAVLAVPIEAERGESA